MLKDHGARGLELRAIQEVDCKQDAETCSMRNTAEATSSVPASRRDTDALLSGTFGDPELALDAIGECNSITFFRDGTFTRAYMKLRRGRDYREGELSGGCDLTMEGTFTVSTRNGGGNAQQIVACTVRSCDISLMHGYSLSDFTGGKRPCPGVEHFAYGNEGSVFTGRLSEEGFVLDGSEVLFACQSPAPVTR